MDESNDKDIARTFPWLTIFNISEPGDLGI